MTAKGGIMGFRKLLLSLLIIASSMIVLNVVPVQADNTVNVNPSPTDPNKGTATSDGPGFDGDPKLIFDKILNFNNPGRYAITDIKIVSGGGFSDTTTYDVTYKDTRTGASYTLRARLKLIDYKLDYALWIFPITVYRKYEYEMNVKDTPELPLPVLSFLAAGMIGTATRLRRRVCCMS